MILKSAISKINGLIPNISIICHLQQVQWFLDFVRKHAHLTQTAIQENSALFIPKELNEAIMSKLTF